MKNGGFHRGKWASTAIIVRRTDIERAGEYARNYASLRDHLIFHLPKEEGLRTGEICTLRREYIDFEDGSFFVFDSKQKIVCPYPLPMDMLTLQLLQDLIGTSREGYVFPHEKSWKHARQDQPLSVQEVWHVIRDIGLRAGVKGLKPRDLREYFAWKWAVKDGKNIVTLQMILRHESLETTQVYVHKLYSWEDMRRDFDSKKAGPLVTETICSDCGIVETCKYAPLPSCVESCRFKTIKKQEIDYGRN
jgi:integrase